MAEKPISQLDLATVVNMADLMEITQAGASKRAPIGLTAKSAPTVPTIVSVGAEFTSTGVPTATLPGTHALNDILVLVIQQSNESNYAAPSGYSQIGPQNGIGAAATAGSTKLCIFWKRDGGAESAPTLTDSGDHTYGVMIAVRGCPTTGDPFRMLGQAFKFTASTTGTADAGTVRHDGALIVNIFAHALDQAGAAGSSPTNASLTNVVENFDDATTDGTGGGIYIMSGTLAVAGEVAASTVTWSGSTVDVSTTLAFVPADAFPTPRGPETMTYIGSPPDLDDTWVKPSGARKVFAQICDGGGSGSGGNTTTTAAGGGGGGGGGYDEAWYEAEDLAATLTVHAGKGGAAGTALNQAGNPGILSEFDKGNRGPLTSTTRIAGIASTAAASADGGNGGCGSGRGLVALVTNSTRADLFIVPAANQIPAFVGGGRGGAGTTAPVGGSPADWGGGGGESGADTDAGLTSVNNGWSLRGAGGGSGGRTNTNISGSGQGGGAAGVISAQGASGGDSVRLPYGGSGGVGGGSTVVTGGQGGFPGGGGGGGAGVAGGFGGRGGHGCVMITTFF